MQRFPACACLQTLTAIPLSTPTACCSRRAPRSTVTRTHEGWVRRSISMLWIRPARRLQTPAAHAVSARPGSAGPRRRRCPRRTPWRPGAGGWGAPPRSGSAAPCPANEAQTTSGIMHVSRADNQVAFQIVRHFILTVISCDLLDSLLEFTNLRPQAASLPLARSSLKGTQALGVSHGSTVRGKTECRCSSGGRGCAS